MQVHNGMNNSIDIKLNPWNSNNQILTKENVYTIFSINLHTLSRT